MTRQMGFLSRPSTRTRRKRPADFAKTMAEKLFAPEPDEPAADPTADEITERAHRGEIWEPISRQWLRATDIAEAHAKAGTLR